MFLLIIDFPFVAPMTFTVDDAALEKTKELIIGTSTHLSCSYVSGKWEVGLPSQPYIGFYRLDKDGVYTEIYDSNVYEKGGEIDKVFVRTSLFSGTRRLQVRRTDAGANATYFCRVKTTHGCRLEKKLVLRTSMVYFQPTLGLLVESMHFEFWGCSLIHSFNVTITAAVGCQPTISKRFCL